MGKIPLDVRKLAGHRDSRLVAPEARSLTGALRYVPTCATMAVLHFQVFSKVW